MSLDELRKKIDELDTELVRLLNDRISIALEIGKLKQESSKEIYVPAREKAVIQRVQEINEGPLMNKSLQAIYREIMSSSLALEHNLKIAYLGPPATFTHLAARTRFGGSVDYAPCETIGEVFDAVERQAADYGVVPIENSTEGAVTYTLDQFMDTRLKICAELYLPISHHLMANCEIEGIQKVYSNPQVFGQCRKWLYEHLPGRDLVSVSSTARAAEMASDDEAAAALASELAAELYSLNILDRDIQDLGGNMTRFLVISRSFGEPTGQDKTSIMFSIQHKSGALYDALSAFRESNLNMSKIESRPSKLKAWEYYFFVDFEGHANDEAVTKALDTLSGHCTRIEVLGSYPVTSGLGAGHESYNCGASGES